MGAQGVQAKRERMCKCKINQESTCDEFWRSVDLIWRASSLRASLESG